MSTSEKSLSGAVLILLAAVIAAYEQNRVAPIVWALLAIGSWMAVSAAIAKAFWDNDNYPVYVDATDDDDDDEVANRVEASGQSSEHA